MKLRSKMKKLQTKLKNGDRKHYSLPTADTEPVTDLRQYTFMIYGPPGAGKTTLAHKMVGDDGNPNLMMMTEGGVKALRCRPVYIRSVKDADRYLKLLIDADNYGGGVLDTAEALFQLFREFHLARLEAEHENDVPYGKGWSATRDPFTRWLQRFLSIPDKGSVVVSHSTKGTRKTKAGDEVEDVHPNIPGKVLDEVTGAVDVVGYLYRERGQAWMRIQQTDDIMAKCRLIENFLHTDGSPVEVIPMGHSAEEGWEALQSAFANELSPPERAVKKKLKLGKKKKRR